MLEGLKKELQNLNKQMASVGSEISNMSAKIIILAEKMSESMEKMTSELSLTNIAIRDSLKTTSDTIQKMSDNFSEALKDTIKGMSEMKVQMDIKDTILKTLGIDGLIPNFLKGNKK